MTMKTREQVVRNVATIRAGIAEACERVGRDPASVTIVAASKTVPAEVMRWAHEEGVNDFGENYVKELQARHIELPGVRWHFVGTLQTNTVHHVARLAEVVHTVEPGNAWRRLARRAAATRRTIPVLIEVDFTGHRTGVAPEELPAFADDVATTEGVRLVGLMTLPPLPAVPEEARPFLRRLRDLRHDLVSGHPEAVELSMGMSLDYGIAVEEGATIVRIGTALFGERPPKT